MDAIFSPKIASITSFNSKNYLMLKILLALPEMIF